MTRCVGLFFWNFTLGRKWDGMLAMVSREAWMERAASHDEDGRRRCATSPQTFGCYYLAFSHKYPIFRFFDT